MTTLMPPPGRCSAFTSRSHFSKTAARRSCSTPWGAKRAMSPSSPSARPAGGQSVGMSIKLDFALQRMFSWSRLDEGVGAAESANAVNVGVEGQGRSAPGPRPRCP